MRLLSSGIIVALLTFVSRIFGLARELFVAYLFGAGDAADSVNVAFKLPNLFRRIFGEGALSAAFIPIFNAKLLKSRTEALQFTGQVFYVITVILVLLIVLIQIAMPKLMILIAPGFVANIEKFDQTILLCRITMPYLLFISLASILGSTLNSVGRFAPFAAVPIILSVGVIIFSYLLNKHFSSTVSISLALILVGALQLIFMLYYIYKANLQFSFSLTISASVRKFFVNMGPATVSHGAQQLNSFISQTIASFIPGAISILSYADRIYQFPLSIIGISFGTILLPALSKIYKKKHLRYGNLIQERSVKIALLLSLPASVGLILLAHPVVHLLFERGAFTRLDTDKTALAISAFTLGLPAFVLNKIFVPVFYANEDNKTPMILTSYSMILNSVLNIILISPFGTFGLGLASSSTAWLNLYLLIVKSRKYRFKGIKFYKDYFYLKLILSTFAMSLSIMLLTTYLAEYFYNKPLLKILTLSFTIILSGAIYIFVSFMFNQHKILKKAGN